MFCYFDRILIAKRFPARIFFLLMVLLAVTSCHSLRKPVHVGRTDVPAGFFEHHSQRLGYRLGGTENPRLIEEVSLWIGTPYRFGGTTLQGADCSGFVISVYRQVYGIALPRSTASMAREVRRIGRHRLREGDLVFFRIQKGRKVSHVGIYLGNQRFIHASTSRGVIVSHLDEAYYAARFVHGGRVR